MIVVKITDIQSAELWSNVATDEIYENWSWKKVKGSKHYGGGPTLAPFGNIYGITALHRLYY